MRARRLALATLGVGLVLSLALGVQLARRAEAEVSARAVAAALIGVAGDAAVDWQAEKRRARRLGFAVGAGGGALLSFGAAALLRRRADR